MADEMTPTPPSTDPRDLYSLESQAKNAPRFDSPTAIAAHELRWLCERAREAERLRAEREAFRAALINSLATSPSWTRVGAQSFVDTCHAQAKGLSADAARKDPK